MNKLVLVTIGAALALSACNNKSDEGTPAPFHARVPETLSFSEPIPEAMPNDAQINEIKATFANKSKMVLPPGSLIFPEMDNAEVKMTSFEKQKEEAKLLKEDPNSYKMLKEIQSSCSASKPVMSSTFPTQGTSEMPKVGSVYSLDAKADLGASSSNCPMTGSADLNLKMVIESKEERKVEKSNMTKLDLGFTGGAGSKIKLAIQKPEYQKLLNARGMIVDTNLSGLSATVEDKTKTYMTANVAGSYMTLDKQIDYSTSVEVQTKYHDKGNIRSQSIFRAEMKFPTFKVSVVTHNISVDGKVVTNDTYLNGNKLSKSQNSKIFNQEVPGIGVIEHSAVLKALQ